MTNLKYKEYFVPWIDVAAAIAILVALTTGIVTRGRTKKILLVPGIVVCLALVAGVVLEGARPQLIALGILALLIVAVVIWARSSRLPGLAVMSAVVLGLTSVGLAGAAWALPPLYVPAGTGAYPVGIDTQVWVDKTRDARGETSSTGGRSLPMTIWYPAQAAGEAAKYLPLGDHAAGLTGALAAQYEIPAIAFDSLLRAHSNATLQGQPADGSFPLVIASPGLGSTRWLSTSWAEELASNGVVVIVLDHPYDAAATELFDGTMAYSEPLSTGDDIRDQALANHAATIRAADMRSVIDQLGSNQGRLPALKSADHSRIIAAGHSLGGAAALEAARLDDRIKGVVDIDGMPRSPEGTRLEQPVLAVVAGDADPNPKYDMALEKVLSNGTGARVTLDGVTHFGLIDASLIIAPIPGITGTRGAGGPLATAQATLLLIEAVSTGDPLDTNSLQKLGKVSTSSP